MVGVCGVSVNWNAAKKYIYAKHSNVNKWIYITNPKKKKTQFERHWQRQHCVTKFLALQKDWVDYAVKWRGIYRGDVD